MKKYLILSIICAGMLSLAATRTPLSTCVNESLRSMLNPSGQFTTLKFSDGTTQTTAGGDLSQTTGILATTKGGTGTNTATLNGFTHTGTSTFPSGVWGNTGNVGIGTTNITEKLTLGDGVTAEGITVRINANAANWAGMGINKAGTEKWFVGMGDTSTYGDKLLLRRTSSSDDMVIDTAGNIGMGTTTPATKLHVIGTLTVSSGIVVAGSTMTVPDYVFDESYRLMPLEELQEYVEINKHLPAFQSEKNTKELNLVADNMALRKTIEELTLYILQIKNEINLLKLTIAD